MTIDQLIALATSVGACLSAIATFWTVRQIAKQREASYRPELVFSRTDFHATSHAHKQSALPTLWTIGRPDDKPAESTRDFAIPLRNVGLGAAKDVAIVWSFPIDEMIERLNATAQRALVPAYFSRDQLGVSIKSETLGTGTWMWNSHRAKVSLDFVLPASVEQEATSVDIPPLYVLLCSAAVFLFFKDRDSKQESSAFELPPLAASIAYTDIGNRRHRMSTSLELQISMIAEAEFHASIDSTKSV
jgi:hypothetical protein